jgi:hypothetical protein
MAAIRGRYLASWVNYDTLDHGGMPPWLLLVYGKLADGTRKYLNALIKRWRDPNSYSDPGVLEIEPNLLSFNTTGGAKAGAEFVSMRDMRTEESMFAGYMKETRDSVCAVLRVSPILFGYIEGAGGSNYAALESAENQVFGPLRNAGDERTNVELIQSKFGIFDWRIATKRAPMGGDGLYRTINAAARAGGPSLNDLTKIQNEVLGTNWQERDEDFYTKISAAEAVALIRQGQVTYDQETLKPIILPPATAGQAQALALANAGLDVFSDMDAGGDAVKSDLTNMSDTERLQPLADTLNLLEAMKRVNARVRNYQAPQITERDHEFKM